MPRKISPERDRARQLYVESGGKTPLRELAKVLHVPEKSLSVWKRRERWDELITAVSKSAQKTAQPKAKAKPPVTHSKKPAKAQPMGEPVEERTDTARAKGSEAPPVPISLTHGLYARMGEVSDEEFALVQSVPPDPVQKMRDMIAEYEIREMRMYKRLRAICERYNIDVSDGMMPVHEVYTAVLKKSKEAPNGGTLTRTKQNAISIIIAMEDALTKLQKLKQEAITNLYRMLHSDVTLEYERRRLMMMEQRESKQLNVEDLSPLAQMLSLPQGEDESTEQEVDTP